MTETERVVRALQKVPQKKLLIVELAWKVLDGAGQLDYQKVIDQQRHINLALAEADAYCRATDRAVRSLKALKPHRGGVYLDDDYDDDEIE